VRRRWLERRRRLRGAALWRVAGWSHSRQAIHEIVAALSRGDELTRFGEPESELASYGETRR
jgi:hypothetical protein